MIIDKVEVYDVPTCGSFICSGVIPVAYNIACDAPWLGGSVIVREYLFKPAAFTFEPAAVADVDSRTDSLFAAKEADVFHFKVLMVTTEMKNKICWRHTRRRSLDQNDPS